MNTSSEQDGEKKPKTRREKWRHAFAIGKDFEEKVTEEDEKILDAFAKAIVKRGMTAPALLWFISMAPMNVIGANLIQAAEFIFKDFAFEGFIQQHFMPTFEHGAFVRAIEKRKGIEKLISLIEKNEAEKTERINKEKTEEDTVE
jgi:hypothetical protein